MTQWLDISMARMKRMEKARIRGYIVLATNNGKQTQSFARRRRRLSRLRVMHNEKVIGGNRAALRPGGEDNRAPGRQGNTVSLLPLLDHPLALTNGFSHLAEAAPQSKDVIDGAHAAESASDELSGQCRITYPVTQGRRKRTICPMGRGKTQADFVGDFCRRVRAAREMAGYADRDAFAKLMGILPDTYSRYEIRTPLPHRYIPRFLELTGADAQILFTGRRETQKKVG